MRRDQGREVEHRLVRWRAGRFEFVDQAVVTVGSGPGDRVGVVVGVGCELADHLAGADVCRVQLGSFLHGEHAEGGAPGLAQQVDLVLIEPVAQVVRDHDRVVDRAVEGEGVGGVELVVGLPRAALVPGDDREVLFELGEVSAHGAELGAAGAAGEEQQHGIVDAVAPDHEVQVVSVDVDGAEFGDAAGDLVAVGVDDRGGGRRPDQQRHEDDEADPGDRGGASACIEAPRVSGLGGTVGRRGEPSSGAGAEHGAEREREQRDQGVEAAAGDERDETQEAGLETVDGGSVGTDSDQLEHPSEDHRRRDDGPPGAHGQPCEAAHHQADHDRPDRFTGRQRATWCPPSGDNAPAGRCSDGRADSDSPVGPHGCQPVGQAITEATELATPPGRRGFARSDGGAVDVSRARSAVGGARGVGVAAHDSLCSLPVRSTRDRTVRGPQVGREAWARGHGRTSADGAPVARPILVGRDIDGSCAHPPLSPCSRRAIIGRWSSSPCRTSRPRNGGCAPSTTRSCSCWVPPTSMVRRDR